MTDQTDLFGHAQASLFGQGEGRMPAPQQKTLPDPQEVRARLRALLEKARSADKIPWPEREARMWQTVFPQMTNWLPEEEAAQLKLEFAAEMKRLAA
ncbi:MAG TPA: hypothetical protein VG821_05350 [Rhizomicrobium sp.]|jgi:hypothetical protein|nr:hypothetical protein [Rhizomicrobium sp.]